MADEIDYKALYEEAKRGRKAVERERDEEKRRREELEQQNEPTDFPTFLSHCHRKLFLSLAVQANPNLSSRTGFTKVDGKHYPLRLEPWASFPLLHEQCQRRLQAVFGTRKEFLPLSHIDVIKLMLSDRPVADEEDMRQFQFLAVEGCTKIVLQKFFALQNRLDGTIRFQNSPYGVLFVEPDAATDASDLPAYVPAMAAARETDAQNRGRPPGDGPPPAKRVTSPRPKLYPDQWCFRVAGDVQVPILVVEYKAAHKLRAETIKTALDHIIQDDGGGGGGGGSGLFSDVIRDVRSTRISQDAEVQAVAAAKRATAQVLVQAFHYMIDFGLHYCYVTSGDALVLLYLNADEPRTLYYHFAVPRDEVKTPAPATSVAAAAGAAVLDDKNLQRTAVALVSTMVLLAFEAPQLTQRWKQDAQATLMTWPVPYAAMEGHSSGDDDEKNANENETGLGNPTRQPPRLSTPANAEGCREPTKGRRKDADDDDRDDDTKDTTYRASFRPIGGRGRGASQTLSPSSRRTTRSSSRSRRGGAGGGRAGGTTQRTAASIPSRRCRPTEYCTQACLLGLCYGGALDPHCPNVRLHRRGRDGAAYHAITRRQFVGLMRQQLAADLDEDCEALDKYGKFGAIGTLFRLVLAGYGYQLVAKGVQRPHVTKLEAEERVYAYLRKHQGTLVPVCLGTVALVTEYWTSSGAHVSHMLLLSYCGEPTWKTCNQKEVTGNIKNDDPSVHIPMPMPAPAEVHRQTAALWQRLHELGIEHGDERAPNTVWNARLGRLMCIDFDWAQIRAEPARDETEPTAAKRQRLSYAVV